MQVQDTARIKTRAWPAMRKQGRAKDWRDLEDRFGSSSQVSPVMTGHILHVYEESSSPAIPGYLFLYLFKGKALNRRNQELRSLSVGRMGTSNG